MYNEEGLQVEVVTTVVETASEGECGAKRDAGNVYNSCKSVTLVNGS